MLDWYRLPLKARLPLIGVPLTVVPVVIMTALGLGQGARTESIAREETRQLADESFDHLAKGVYAMCDTQQALGLRMLATYLAVAREQLPAGGVVAAGPSQSWNVVSQFTKASQEISLPQFTIGHLPIPTVRTADQPVPVVDAVKALLGSQCTLFQRMNADGDMVRVATTVVGADGARAIGTFIPRVMADGSANPVLARVLKGETFLGRAFVVNAWLQSGYMPLRNARGEVQGMLFIGIPTGGEARVRETLVQASVAKTGHAAVFDGTGAYIIPPKGLADGTKMWDARDVDGQPWVQRLIAAAKGAPAGTPVEFRYTPTAADGATPATMVARATYFEPWDWIITVAAPAAELEVAEARIAAVSKQGAGWSILVGLLAVAGSVATWYFTARRLAGRFGALVRDLRSGAEQVLSASSQVASSSQSLSQGATEQAASLEETSAAMEEMASMTRKNAENSQAAAGLVHETEAAVRDSNAALGDVVTAMTGIRESSGKISKIIKTIDEIAFQTNILALNAAVEAARAGEAGMGFAVVADEVRNLAQRSAQAAKDTAGLIEDAITRSEEGSGKVEHMAVVIAAITDKAGKVKALVDEISEASHQQTQGFDQVTQAVAQLEKVTQTTAATAEEGAAASEELGEQAAATTVIVSRLSVLVDGAAQSSPTASSAPDAAARQRARRAA